MTTPRGVLWGAVLVLLVVVCIQLVRDRRADADAKQWRKTADSVQVVNAGLLASVDSVRAERNALTRRLRADSVRGDSLASEAERLRGVLAGIGAGPTLPPTPAPAPCEPWAARVAYLETRVRLTDSLAAVETARANGATLAAQAANAGRLEAIRRGDSLTVALAISDSLLRTAPRARPVRLAVALEGRARTTGEGEAVAGLASGSWRVAGVLDQTGRRSVEVSYRRNLRVW